MRRNTQRSAPPGNEAAADAELIARVKGGSSEALEEIYRRYASPVYSLVWKILQSPEESEDVALDVFWQIWRQAGSYDSSRGAPPAWIFTLARSRAIDRLRARHRKEDKTISFDDPAVILDPLDQEATPDQVASYRQNRDAVREAMKVLSAPQREAVELAFFQGLTHVEIAEKLKLPLGTVKTRIRQGLIRLRRRLD
jgi:RNA polymerase sigma-70 factor, ECF subfamily